MFFLSGLPRSGSTVLGSLLSQHPEIHVTPTSPLPQLLNVLDDGFREIDKVYTYDKTSVKNNVYKSVLENFYNHIDKKYVIDKNRCWTKNVKQIQDCLNEEPKIICTNRRISEVITSYITLIESSSFSNNFLDNNLRRQNIDINNHNRSHCLWEEYICDPYESLLFGLENFRKNIHLIDYNDLMSNPKEELNKIYSFLEIESFDGHDFDNIINTCAELNDFAWGIENLHKIRKQLKKTSPSPEEIIGKNNVIYFDKFNL